MTIPTSLCHMNCHSSATTKLGTIHGVSISVRIDSLPADRAVEQQRDRQPAGERPADRGDRVDGRVLDRAEEARPQRVGGVEEDRLVVVEARRRRVEQQREGEGVELLEGEVDAAERGQRVHEHHEQRRRRDQRPGQAPARGRRAHPAPRARRRAADEPGLMALGHRRRAHRARISPCPGPAARWPPSRRCCSSFVMSASLELAGRRRPRGCSRSAPCRRSRSAPHCGIGA